MRVSILNSKLAFFFINVALIGLILVTHPGLLEARTLSQTDFTGFTTGVSVDGQDGWAIGITTPNLTVDEEVMDDGTGNIVWRYSNAVGSGDLNDAPFAPRLAGTPKYPADPGDPPVNGIPELFAGESSTTAYYRRFGASFDFSSATGAAQANLGISLSADNGAGGRMSYLLISDTGSGIDLIVYDVDSAGNFVGPTTIATGLNYTDWHNVSFEILFYDGASNDVVNIYLEGTLIHTGTSWEDYYPVAEPTNYAFGVPVQTLVFSPGSTSYPSNNGGGFYFDNINIEITDSVYDKDCKCSSSSGCFLNTLTK